MVLSTQIARIDGSCMQNCFLVKNANCSSGLMLAASIDDEQVYSCLLSLV